MIELRQSTAGQEIPLGYFLDSTDGNAEETGLTIANTDIKLWKWGATTLANKNSGGGTHISNGIYYAVLDDTDSNTLGALIIFVHIAGALAVKVECAVITQNAWDSKYGTDKLEVDLIQMGGVAQSATDLKDFADAGYDPATNKVNGVKLVDVTTENTDMVGTDGANTTTPPTVAEIQTELEEDGASLLDTIRDELANETDGLSALKTLIDAIPTTAMRGTDNAALASVVGALADAAAAGEVTEADTLVQYIKQLINILIGAAGIGAFPAEAAPANAVSLAEVIRAIHVDVTGLNGDAMRGTNSANTVIPDVAGTAPTATEIQTEMEENGASVLDSISDLLPASTIAAATDIPAMVGTNNAALASVCTEGRLAELAAANLPTDIDAIKAKTDNQPAGIPKNVALSKFPFLMVDSTDHFTPKTGLTVTAQTNKDGAGFAGSTNSVVEVANGWYEIDWTQAEMNFDIAAWKFTAAGADQRDITIKTST